MNCDNGTAVASAGTITIDVTELARRVAQARPELRIGVGEDGKVVLPNRQDVADALAGHALELVGRTWRPGDPPAPAVQITGPGPIWAYLRIAHSLHGRVPRLAYVGPACPDGIVVFDHGHGAGA